MSQLWIAMVLPQELWGRRVPCQSIGRKLQSRSRPVEAVWAAWSQLRHVEYACWIGRTPETCDATCLITWFQIWHLMSSVAVRSEVTWFHPCELIESEGYQIKRCGTVSRLQSFGQLTARIELLLTSLRHPWCHGLLQETRKTISKPHEQTHTTICTHSRTPDFAIDFW